MDFIKEELLEKRCWRWTNELLKRGSQWMLNRFGGDGCNTIATIFLFAMFGWTVIGGAGVAIIATGVSSCGSFISFVIALIVFLIVMVGILVVLMMSTANAKKPGS